MEKAARARRVAEPMESVLYDLLRDQRRHSLGVAPESAAAHEVLHGLSLALRSKLVDRMYRKVSHAHDSW